eukprot:10413300-Heterocapsa_arctica.AAC.1
MQRSGGSWEAAAARFVNDATAWRPAAPLRSDPDDDTHDYLCRGSISWNRFAFPMVTGATYLGGRPHNWNRGLPSYRHPTTHCGD